MFPFHHRTNYKITLAHLKAEKNTGSIKFRVQSSLCICWQSSLQSNFQSLKEVRMSSTRALKFRPVRLCGCVTQFCRNTPKQTTLSALPVHDSAAWRGCATPTGINPTFHWSQRAWRHRCWIRRVLPVDAAHDSTTRRWSRDLGAQNNQFFESNETNLNQMVFENNWSVYRTAALRCESGLFSCTVELAALMKLKLREQKHFMASPVVTFCCGRTSAPSFRLFFILRDSHLHSSFHLFSLLFHSQVPLCRIVQSHIYLWVVLVLFVALWSAADAAHRSRPVSTSFLSNFSSWHKIFARRFGLFNIF